MKSLEVIHENNDYIVVNKKAGLISEKSPFENDTVEDQVFKHLLKNAAKAIAIVHAIPRARFLRNLCSCQSRVC